MKNIHKIFILTICAAIVFSLSACNKPAASPPRLVVNDPEFNFGEQPNTQIIEHVFEVRNEGGEVLRINNIRSTCGCTAGQLSTSNINPGASAQFTARYNLHRRNGPQKSVLTLESNDPTRPKTQLTMIGEAIQYLEIDPNFIFFGQVEPGAQLTQTVELKGRETEPFEITLVNLGEGSFKVLGVESPEPHHHRITVGLDAPEKPGMVQDRLIIHTTHPMYPEISMPATAQVPGPLEFIPQSINLTAGVATPITSFIVVRPGTVDEFSILSVTTPMPEIEAKLMPQANQSYTIRISNLVASREIEGQSIIIQTDSEAMPEISIPIILQTPSKSTSDSQGD